MLTDKNSILIVEDESLSIRALSDILRHDYTIYVEKKSRKTLESTKRLSPDLILLDVMMPEMSGFEVIVELKKDEATKDIPVIFVTGLTNADDESRGLAYGAVDYINKPYRPSIVKMRVQHQMKIVNLVRKLQNLSTIDDLTGVGNRRYFIDSLEQEWERAKRTQTPIGIMMLDLDHFKNLNDTYGHQNGDIALVHAARIIDSEVKRASDKVARWGGEEFAVIQPNTTLEGVHIVAEEVRMAIERSLLHMEGHEPVQMTVSIGINCIVPSKSGGYSLDDLISDADKALYRAKREGRNRVCSLN